MLFRGFFALHFAGNIGSKVIKFFFATIRIEFESTLANQRLSIEE